MEVPVGEHLRLDIFDSTLVDSQRCWQLSRWKYRWVNILDLIYLTPHWWIARGASNCLRWKDRLWEKLKLLMHKLQMLPVKKRRRDGSSFDGNKHDLSEGSGSVTVKNNQFTSPDDYAPKIRKPYTITKQRERWTEEEHKKFLEALKLHGRAWRRIEEHVGTKSAVQIRSHAQKFFSKVVRESTSRDVNELKPIEIPPPRPKRKPLHPYPRKLSAPVKTGGQHETSPNSSGSDQENESPTSALSTDGSKNFGLGDSDSPNADSSANGVKLDLSLEENESSPPTELESCCDEEKRSPDVRSTQSLKLFGKTVMVMDTCSSDMVDPCEGSFLTLIPKKTGVGSLPCGPPVYYMQFLDECSGSSSSVTPWWSLHGSASHPVAQLVKPTKQRSEQSAFRKQHRGDAKKKDTCINIKGFVPYKRCVDQRDSDSSSEEREELRVRLVAFGCVEVG
ncbi:hypothetical protein E3N88_05012 [Mikania micrantha]|uniref:Uncharacterized protein n=1 Tax=Mikania micrantha TaxID=192012 RepID=A0A5N6PW25_9ASTR|nr:hypothetical protein E3N88_05012 [Mikania micrantha]